MVHPTASNLIEALRHYHLLEAAQLEEAGCLAATGLDPRGLAKELLQRGWLTAYQVNQLLQGKGAELLLGSYVLLERLGEGGMGAVFKARNWKLGKIVALKLIRKEQLAEPGAVPRFQREVRAVAQLSHPNIVMAYDADEVNGIHFFTMEFVPGTDLRKLVKQQGPLPVHQACEYIRQAACGLAHAHDKGMVHRDIKPANLLLTQTSGGRKPPDGGLRPPLAEETIKILDLGLARLQKKSGAEATASLTEAGAIMGTPEFMAPEQCRSSRGVDIRSDLYSLGCTLYYLLTGAAPFSGETVTETMLMHIMEEPERVEKRRPEVPADVALVVRKLMAKKPEDRYQTPNELLQDLDAVQAGQPLPIAGCSATVAGATVRLGSPQDSDTSPQGAPSKPAADGSPSGATEVSFSPRCGRSILARYRWLLLGGAGLLTSGALFVFLLMRDGQPTPTVPSLTTAADSVAEELRLLLARADDSAVPPDELRRELLQFRQKHPGTAHALQVAARLMRLRSPLDDLKPQNIPKLECFPSWQPTELVAVFGEHRLRHWGTVSGVAISPDSKTVASVGGEAVVHLWDIDRGVERARLQGHTNVVTSVAFSPDGKILASAGHDFTIRLWGACTYQERAVLKGTKGHTNWIAAIAFTPNGQGLISGGADGTVKRWSLSQPDPLYTLKAPSAVTCMALSPDGKTLATASHASDTNVTLWDLERQEVRTKLTGHTAPLFTLVFAPDGRSLLSGGADGSVRRWDTETGEELAVYAPNAAHITALAYAPNGETFAVGSQYGVLHLWDSAAGKAGDPLLTRFYQSIASLAFSRDGTLLVSGGADGTVRIWDVAQRRERFPLRGHIGSARCLAVAPDGRTVATGGRDTTVKLWNVATGTPRHELREHIQTVTSVTFAPDGRTLASSSDDTTVRLWDSASGRNLFTLTGGGAVRALAFSPDGRVLAGAADGKVTVWDLTARKPRTVLEGLKGQLWTVAFAPDGRSVASGDLANQVQVWDPVSGRVRATYKSPHQVHSLVYAPNGRALFVGTYPQVVRWDVGTGKELPALKGVGPFVESLSITLDAKLLAASGNNGAVGWWDTASGTLLGSFTLPGPVTSVAWAADGRHLLTANANGTVYVLRLGRK